MEKKIFKIYIQKEFTVVFCCRLVKIIFPILFSKILDTSYFSQNRFSRMYVQIMFAFHYSREKLIIHNKKTIYMLYRICKVVHFQLFYWLKIMIIIKCIWKFSLCKTPFLDVSEKFSNCLFFGIILRKSQEE